MATEADPAAVGDDFIAVCERLVLPAPLNRIEVQQVGCRGCVAGNLVDLDDLYLGVIPERTQRKATHAAEAIHPYSNRHLLRHRDWFYRRSPAAK